MRSSASWTIGDEATRLGRAGRKHVEQLYDLSEMAAATERLYAARPRRVSFVLCYHAVSADWHDPLSVAPRTLARQVGRGTPVGLEADDARRRRRRAAVARSTSRSTTRSAASWRRCPCSSALAVPATVFACTDFVGRTLDLPPLRSVAPSTGTS